MNRQRCEQLYRLHYRAMYRYAYTILYDADDAHDVVSDAWIVLLQNDTEIDDSTAEAYLKRITHNICVNRLKHIKVEEKAQRLLPYEMETMTNDDEIADEERKWEMVGDFIKNEFNADTQMVLKMRYQEQLSYKDMADKLGVSTSSINKHISSALRKLRNKFRH